MAQRRPPDGSVSERRPDADRSVLLAGSDLMARERIRSAAAHLEMASHSVTPAELLDALRRQRPDVLVLDLDEGRESLLAELETARSEGLAPARVLGFYSHVDAELGRAAERADCKAVRRGRFWASLGDLLAATD